MKTLGEIISLRQNKYNEERKNPSISEFYQGRFDGWYSAYRDLKEILEQNGFNLDVPVIDVAKTNADHIRSMTDEELAEFIYYHKQETCSCCELTETDGACTETLCVNATLRWLKQPYKENS